MSTTNMNLKICALLLTFARIFGIASTQGYNPTQPYLNQFGNLASTFVNGARDLGRYNIYNTYGYRNNRYPYRNYGSGGYDINYNRNIYSYNNSYNGGYSGGYYDGGYYNGGDTFINNNANIANNYDRDDFNTQSEYGGGDGNYGNDYYDDQSGSDYNDGAYDNSGSDYNDGGDRSSGSDYDSGGGDYSDDSSSDYSDGDGDDSVDYGE